MQPDKCTTQEVQKREKQSDKQYQKRQDTAKQRKDNQGKEGGSDMENNK